MSSAYYFWGILQFLLKLAKSCEFHYNQAIGPYTVFFASTTFLNHCLDLILLGSIIFKSSYSSML